MRNISPSFLIHQNELLLHGGPQETFILHIQLMLCVEDHSFVEDKCWQAKPRHQKMCWLLNISKALVLNQLAE